MTRQNSDAISFLWVDQREKVPLKCVNMDWSEAQTDFFILQVDNNKNS